MPLTSGAKLGPYEILSPLGVGGMGEVYRARDTRLDRIVAIKILPSHLSHDPTLRQRFEREAKTISSLNDPHICILYDVGQQGGADYLVMEYLEGETLAQRLQKGPLPLEQALLYAIQIAGALDKAHRKGVTHRDLKPGNIMLTKTGTKLLDFGLAKLEQEVGPPAALSQLPTTAQGSLTAQGTIVGTLQYMAPEQLEGGGVDARTDIFAFGAVVYEMVTGKKAFEGKGQASVIAAILGGDPPAISSLQLKTPPELDRVVKKCLAKEPEQRWQGAGDLCDELKWIAEGAGQLALAPTAVAKGIRAGGRVALLWGVIALLVAAIIGLAVWNLKPTPPPPVIRAVITLPPGQQLVVPDQPAVALSPDGTKLVYVAIQGATQQLYLRAMDSLEATPVPNTDGATIPFFSPDSQSLGFFAGGKLKRVSMSQGSAQSLADAKFPRGASWTSQGMIVFCPTAFGTIDQVSEAGGTPQPLTHFEKGAMINAWPDLLPGGKEVVFASSENPGNWTNAHIFVQSMETGVRRVLAEVGSQPRYAASGHLIFAQSGILMAVPFNDQRLEVAGAAVPVVEGILQSPATGDAQYSISNTGSLVYVPGHVRAAQRQLVWVNRKGAEQTTGAPERSYRFPRVSPNNRQVAATIDDQESQIWLYDLSRETLTRLTSEGNTNLAPAWTPDGNRISFQSNKTGPANIYWQPADGSSGMERLTSHDITQVPSSWTPDGKFLAYIETTPTTGYDIWVLRLSDRKAQPFLQTPFNESAPRFSPDGRWLAYVSDESGRYEVYVQPFPGPGGKYPISTEGGTEPVWNPKGRELFYRSGDKMMAVDIATQPSFSAGKPKVLFEGHYQPTPLTFPNYDVSPDGQRFLMLKPVEAGEGAPTQIDVVLNWFEELKRRVPAGKK